ncbi:MAG: pssA: CDP-diacylglycerol-serine O-phosphatidyltransferase [Firmicutes bacterium]|nr:pssA: CDP-diacylglycerol-serine O-phosphatidyltransferase [Bacillota bacterium]
MRNAIPNIVTAVNLVFGMFAIIFTFQGELFNAALFVVAAMVADGMDGRVARYFGVSSDFGKELDSLCDVVSFGVAPAIMAYVYMLQEFPGGALIAAAFAICGALRLARFNVNTGVVKGYFMGLPIPAAGCVVATFVMLGVKPTGWLFPLMVLVFAYLMVSTVRYPDFKGKDGEPIRVIPAVISVAIGAYILFITFNAILFVPFFVFAIFGIFNTVFGMFDRQ